MRQTGINPQTEQKLSGTKRRSSSSTNSDGGKAVSIIIVPIRTPSALLARDPYQLSSTLEVSLDSIKQLRSTVAECVVCDPIVGHGGRALEIINGVTKFCVGNNDDDGHNDNDHNDGHQYDNENDHDHLRRPSAITVGAVTALDLYAQSLLMKRLYSSYSSSSSAVNSSSSKHHHHNNNPTQQQQPTHHPLEYISTGSMALDTLLLPNNNGCYWWDNNLSFPFQIPNFDCSSNNNNNNNATTTWTTSSSSSSAGGGGGIPFGQITELSGKPSSGKTQLALSITAHAVVVNKLQVKYLLGGGSSRIAISRRLFAVCLALVRSRLHQQQQQQRQQQQPGEGGNNNNNDGKRTIMMMIIDKEAKSIAFKCMERVTIAIVPDAYSLLGTLAQIENDEQVMMKQHHHHDDNNNQGTLVVVDSISGCLGHHIYSDLTVGASLSNQVLLTLRRMTRSYDGHFDSNSDSVGSSSVGVRNDSNSYAGMLLQNPPRRFAVVVINGTVGKGANDSSKSEVSSASSHKPAMGRYWQGGDMGLWLDEEAAEEEGGGNTNSSLAMSFYDGNVAGLSRSSEKVVTATLQWHYGKLLVDVSSEKGEQGDGRHARFAIQAGGVVDV